MLTFSRIISSVLIAASLIACSNKPGNIVRVHPQSDYHFRPSSPTMPEMAVINDLSGLSADSPGATTEATALRIGVKEAAIRLGAAHGYLFQMSRYRVALEEHIENLDKIFDFAEVQTAAERNGRGIVQSYGLPPVIDEAKEQIAVEAQGKVLRTSNGMYRIRRQAKLTTEKTTWRKYLYGNEENMKPEAPLASQLPTNAEERAIWRKGITDGFSLGKKQAQREMYNRVLSLRDYVGMVRYVRLVDAGIVIPTEYAVTKRTVTGDNEKIWLGQTEVRINREASLNKNINEYQFIEESDRSDINTDFTLPDPDDGTRPNKDNMK